MFYMYIENKKINGVGEVKQLDNSTLNIAISQDVFENYKKDQLTYSYINGKIIRNPDYETQKKKLETKLLIEETEQEIENLDKKRIRAICENEVRNQTTGETWLDFYNEKIKELRKKLARLNSTI